MGALVAGFEKKYGLKATIWRAGSREGAAARRHRGARQPAHGRHHRDQRPRTRVDEPREDPAWPSSRRTSSQLIPQALRPHGEWVGTRLNVFVQAWNTKLVKKEELPKTWEDLLNPRWKGRLGIEAEDQDWLAGVCGELGEAKGVKLFKDIVAANGMSVRKGHTLLTQLVVSGEIPLGADGLQLQGGAVQGEGRADRLVVHRHADRPAQRRRHGARPRPTRTRPCCSTTSRSARKGRRSSPARDFVPTNTKVENPFKSGLRFVDARMMLDEVREVD